MADTSTLGLFEPYDPSLTDPAQANRHTLTALERHKREGLDLAVRARWIALAVVAVLLPFLNPSWEMLYYEVLLGVVAWIGWLQTKVGRVGWSRAELMVLQLDVLVMVAVLTFPNPFSTDDWPTAMVYRFDNFSYMYIILALATLSCSWRTIIAIGNWTAVLWFAGAGLVWYFGKTMPELTTGAEQAFGYDPDMVRLFDPNSINFDIRLQQVVIFVLVAGTLGVSIRRFNRLVLNNAGLERTRENLSRYFSPNVVEDLSQNDEPLKEIRSHDVAVIFADLEGFTRYAAERTPEDVITTLRAFSARMEQAVFAQKGTLDKFLGDGLMATFGTPFPQSDDVRRAYHCARRMIDLAEAWNAERVAAGQERLNVRVGLHFGPVVLGDIGSSRLEFAVIGNTVNVASRLEALTRPLGVSLVLSDAVYRKLPQEETQDLSRVDQQTIRGIENKITVWTLP
jgi:adenylate cyclase